jgi:hypothetical protein
MRSFWNDERNGALAARHQERRQGVGIDLRIAPITVGFQDLTRPDGQIAQQDGASRRPGEARPRARRAGETPRAATRPRRPIAPVGKIGGQRPCLVEQENGFEAVRGITPDPLYRLGGESAFVVLTRKPSPAPRERRHMSRSPARGTRIRCPAVPQNRGGADRRAAHALGRGCAGKDLCDHGARPVVPGGLGHGSSYRQAGPGSASASGRCPRRR